MTADIRQLIEACPGAASDFLVAQLEAGATIEQAKDRYITALIKRAEAAEKRVTELMPASITRDGRDFIARSTADVTPTPTITPNQELP